jgi:hypothetical protein
MSLTLLNHWCNQLAQRTHHQKRKVSILNTQLLKRIIKKNSQNVVEKQQFLSFFEFFNNIILLLNWKISKI